MAAPPPPPLVSEVYKRWDECQSHHGYFVQAYERRERAYKGILSIASDAARWRHKHAPPYAFNLIETIVSNTIEMGLRFDVRPSPKVNIPLEEAMEMLAQSEAVGNLLRHEHRVDEMDYKQRPLYLTAAIGGRGVGKSYWNYSEGAVRRQGVEMESVYDDAGNEMLQVPVIKDIVEQGILRDHSTFEVVDPRDWCTHESAKTLQPWDPGGAQFVFHRCWYSFEQLKMMEAAGFVKNVDFLKESRDQSDEYVDREQAVYNINRTKDLIEVLEYWCMEGGIVHRALVANRNVLLKDKEDSPFWHGGYPFVICSSMPQPFTTIGTSDIELIESLQEILWELGNQRLDNVELINNFITLIRSDIDDPDAFEYYPGARWPIDGDPRTAVMPLQPPYQLAEVSLSAEGMLKGDLQNVTSAAPFASGAETATVDQKTATGASIVMSAAQQRLTTKKYQAQQGLKQEANMRIKNCQQFLGEERLVHIIGPDGAMKFKAIDPLKIQGEFICELEPMGESQMRETRRAESSQFFQVMMQAAPMMAAAGAPMNMKELFGWFAKKWGMDDWERFFSQQAPAMGAMDAGGPAGGPGGPSNATEGPNMGITSSTAVDAGSPSATGGMSMSGSMMMQRALAMGGGPNNV